MSVEGIFRKNGNIRRMNQVIECLDRDPSSVDFSQDNPVQLAALLKRFLRDLPDPLMTYKLHKLWIMTQSTFHHKHSPFCLTEPIIQRFQTPTNVPIWSIW